MGKSFYGDIEAIPGYKTIKISLSPIDDGIDNFYELEISRSPNILSSLLSDLHAMSDIGRLISMPTEYAQKAINRSFSHFYTSDDNINEIIDKYTSDFTPDSEFPSDGQPQTSLGISDFTIKESIKLDTDIVINNQLITKGNRINFYHKGKI